MTRTPLDPRRRVNTYTLQLLKGEQRRVIEVSKSVPVAVLGTSRAHYDTTPSSSERPNRGIAQARRVVISDDPSVDDITRQFEEFGEELDRTPHLDLAVPYDYREPSPPPKLIVPQPARSPNSNCNVILLEVRCKIIVINRSKPCVSFKSIAQYRLINPVH